jgi:hypothetical protein
VGRRRMRSGRLALRVKSAGEGGVSELKADCSGRKIIQDPGSFSIRRALNPERDTWRKRISKQRLCPILHQLFISSGSFFSGSVI